MKQLLFVLTLFLFACGDNSSGFDDYREEFIGIYDCTKSNRGFDDDMFTREIEVEVILDSLSENSIIINGFTIEIDEDGKHQGGSTDEDMHDLDLSDGKIRWEVNVFNNNIPGIALPCYIKGEKRD